MTDDDVVESFSAGLSLERRAIVDRLASAILDTRHPLTAAIKWRQLTFAVEGDYHHWICGVVVSKAAVSLAFHFGGLLDDPEGRFRIGSSKFGRRLDYHAPDEVDDVVVQRFVDEAVERLPYFRENWRAIQAAG